MGMKPIAVEGYTCPTCQNQDTVSLEQRFDLPPKGSFISNGFAVLWCVNGHVTAFAPNKPAVLIHSFAEGRRG